MRDYYCDVWSFEEIPAGAGMNPPKRWLKNEDSREMHLILNKREANSAPKSYHIAFTEKIWMLLRVT